METAQRPTIRERAERICNVALSLPWCQPRLGLRRARPCKKIGTNWKVPAPAEPVREHLALIVAALAPASGRERHRHERRTLALDVRRKSQRGHVARHRLRERAPPVILERVHDDLRGAPRQRERGARGAHEGRQQRTPRAAGRGSPHVHRMAAPVAARTRKLLCAQPARPADELTLVRRARRSTHRARGGKEQVAQRRAGTAERRDRCDRCACQRSARHIASRSGAMPNQRSKESAPCSTSIPSPSVARWPAARAARTHAVSPAR